MKKYLIGIGHDCHFLFTRIYGDTPSRPFTIANNLWNYQTPWAAARRLEILAKSWESMGFTVKRFYGYVSEMPTAGNEYNATQTINDYQ